MESRTAEKTVQEKMADLLAEDIPSIKSNEIFDYIVAKRNEIKFITIKFTTLDMEVFTQSYAETMTIGEIRQILSGVFNIAPEFIVIEYDDELQDDLVLGSFDAGKHSMLNFNLKSSNKEQYISAKYAYRDLTVPDIITVTVTYDDGSTKEIVVEIEQKQILKPYLGGYLNKVTQIEYHHGYTQTGPKPKKNADKFTHRDTQTYWMRNRKLDTTYSRATQMARSDLYIPSLSDKILTAGPYETADERDKRLDIEGKVRIIQRYFRAWKMRKALKLLSAEYRKRLLMEDEELKYLAQMDIERKNRELIGKIFPRTKADFFMLYTMLENWKKAEIDRIKLMSCGPSRIAEMYLLLEKEIKLLLSIEKQKEIVQNDMRIKKDIKFMKIISTPLAWNSHYKNLYITMDTLETQRGREYYAIYRNLCDHTLSREGRLKIYLEIKMALDSHINCEFGLEIVGLIERACVLIARGISDCHLENLHKRIEATYFRHLQMTSCNENVAVRNARVKEKIMENNLFYCKRCNNFKTHDQFAFDVRSKTISVCNNCAFFDRTMEPWMDIQPYRYLLKCIRREERRQSCNSSIVFIITDKHIHHLVTQIWHSHSAISECNDIYKLRLCRFFRDEDWAPWNCVLLTYEETKSHLKIKKLDEVYDQEFLCDVYKKHVLARTYFASVCTLENYFQELGRIETRWEEIIEHDSFIAVNSKEKIFWSCH